MNLAQLTNGGIEIIALASGDGERPGPNQETRRDTVVLRTRLTELIVGQPNQDRHSLFGVGGAPRLSQLAPQASAHQVRVLVGHLPRGIHISQLTQQEGHGLPRAPLEAPNHLLLQSWPSVSRRCVHLRHNLHARSAWCSGGIKAARRAQSMARSTSAISTNASAVSSAHAETDPSLA